MSEYNINPTARLKIIGLEGKKTTVEAQFNPKEVSFDKSVPWQKQKKSKGDAADLEFTGAEPMTMSFELMFDAFEDANGDVIGKVNDLISLAQIDEAQKRPSKVKVIWGQSTESTAFTEFQGVIESVATKITMFSPSGKALRATCNVKLKQGSNLGVKK